MKIVKFSLFWGGLLASQLFAVELHELVESTKLIKYQDITFYVRLPTPSVSENKAAVRYKPKYAVRGVLAIGTWKIKPEDARKNVEGGQFSELIRFADRNNLAVLTWTNFKGYRTDISGDEMDEDRYKQYDKDFDDRAREWRHGLRRLCRKHKLPEHNLLAYGLSGGGQMIHRLALRMPEHFFAVHIHVNSSYDQIKRDGNEVLWLVTTGTREYGYPAAVRFYREALDAGYHMIFRAEENLGHRDSAETRATGMAFWNYCLKFLPDATDPDWRAPPVDRFHLMRYPAYVGDYLNTESFKRDVAPKYIAPEVMVALPTKEIARAWGTVVDIE